MNLKCKIWWCLKGRDSGSQVVSYLSEALIEGLEGVMSAFIAGKLWQLLQSGFNHQNVPESACRGCKIKDRHPTGAEMEREMQRGGEWNGVAEQDRQMGSRWSKAAAGKWVKSCGSRELRCLLADQQVTSGLCHWSGAELSWGWIQWIRGDCLSVYGVFGCDFVHGKKKEKKTSAGGGESAPLCSVQ